jgi:hypothetical protein
MRRGGKMRFEKQRLFWVAALAWLSVAACAVEAEPVEEPVGEATSELGSPCSADADCGGTQYCARRTGQCSAARGRCQTKPTVCTKELRQVCGCDGVTYGNSCQAAAAGVSVASNGACH